MTGTGASDFTIRPVKSIAEYHACEQLQRHAWGFSGDLDVIPLTQLRAAQQSGGLVLGAFDKQGRLGGLCYGFLGQNEQGRLVHHSHMTAVDAEFRFSGLGARLKWAQRRAVLDQGLDLMVWTYDPLESLNAYFNFAKLGVVAMTYFEDYYGETSSSLHRGSPTDRLRADWYLKSGRVESRRRGRKSAVSGRLAADPELVPTALAGVIGAGGLMAPGPVGLDIDAECVRCEIPVSVQDIMAIDPDMALAWRMATRAVLTAYLERQYVVRECVRTGGATPRTFYVLERLDSVELDD